MTRDVRRFGDVIDYIRGITFTPEDIVDPSADGAVACMRTKNIQHLLDVDDLIAVPAEFVRREELYLRPGDVLISSANSWELVGKACAVPYLEFPATAGGFIAILRSKGDLEPRYMAHWLRAPATQHALRRCARKTTNIANLSVPQVEALPVPVPPLAEQRRIADMLDKADAIRRKRKAAIALTDSLLRSTFLDMFGDPVTNPKGWSLRPLGELVRETRLGLGRAASEQGDERRYPYLRMNSIRSNGTLDLSGLTKVDAAERDVEDGRLVDGDFLFNTRNSRELVGKVAVFHGDGDFLFNNNILRMRFIDDLEPDFLCSYWQTTRAAADLDARKSGTTSVFAIYYKDLATMPIPFPPSPAQRRFADVCRRARALLADLDEAIFQSQALFTRVVDDAFRAV